jgi:mycothiol synthase
MNELFREKIMIQLPEGFLVRGAKLEDVEPALELFNAWSQSVINEDEITDAAAIRTEWVSPGFDPANDICLVFDPDGLMVGYIEVWTTAKPPVHPWIWGRVHPDYGDFGIGTYLLQWAEERACKALEEIPADVRFAPRVGIYRQAEASKQLFADMGYKLIRSSYRMRIDMDAPPPAPVWPEGITLRTYHPEKDAEAVYRADNEAFRDHFGFVEPPFEEGFERFKHFMTDYEGFDPTLYFLAMDDDEIAGFSLCRPNSYEDPDLGIVNVLGVRRAWRKRGIGLALLHHSFGELYRRGKQKVGLSVDAENLTGALRLYEKAGMHVHHAFDLYEKVIRPGREISVESLQD